MATEIAKQLLKERRGEQQKERRERQAELANPPLKNEDDPPLLSTGTLGLFKKEGRKTVGKSGKSKAR